MTTGGSTIRLTDYFRRDQKSGITPPDLSKTCTYAEHIVHARGKRTQLTSVTLDLQKCRDFGEIGYRLKRPEADNDGHTVVEHASLITALQTASREAEKAEREMALQALRYARRRLEGVVKWSFQIQGIERKDLMPFAEKRVQPYFSRV